jgi:heat-inducible transcriptional repressor
LRSVGKELTRSSLTTEGEEYLFAQPEFQRDAIALSEVLDFLKEGDTLMDVLTAPVDQPTTVTIGRENRQEPLRQFSVVRQSFYVGENEAGAIALIGPTRMHYETSIPLVNFAAQALSNALTKFFG